MKTILITGGAGFIGSNFVRYVLQNEPEWSIIVLDALTYAGNIENLRDVADKIDFVRGNINNIQDIKYTFKNIKIDTVVHFAAETHVDRSILYPHQFVKTNVNGTLNLLTESLKNGVERFHHISTDEVYGSLSDTDAPTTEDAQYKPNSPYSASKAGSDHLVRAFGNTYGLPYTISNSSNNYGAYQFPEKLVPMAINCFVKHKKLPIYGNGKHIRDWIYVNDNCSGILHILKYGKIGECYNVAAGAEATALDIALMIAGIMDREMSMEGATYGDFIEFVCDRPGNDYRYALDISKICELGWYPGTSLYDGMEQTVKWYLSHMDWLEKTRNSASYKAWLRKNYFNRIETLGLYKPLGEQNEQKSGKA